MLAAVVYTSPGFLVISLAVVVFGIWVAVDASKYPDWAFQRSGTQKWLYTVLTPIAGFLCGIVAIVFGIMWFASKKNQVDQTARGGGPPAPGTYGTMQPPPPPPPPGSWSPPPPPPPHDPSGGQP